MDEFDFLEEKPKSQSKFGSALWNVLSTLFAVASLIIGGLFTQIFLDPGSDLNPLPPVTATATQVPASPTPSGPTGTPTITLAPSETPTLAPTPTYEPGSRYNIQEGSPTALDASVFHPEAGCNFSGVAGQAFGLDGAPVAGLRVHVSGTWNGAAVDKIGLTGAASSYGSGSYYEVQLGDQAIASDDTLNIVLLNPAGDEISNIYSFDTYASCDQNLVLINFSAIP
jgi:hypothetical protein